MTNTNESCMVCHTTDKLAAVSVVHPVPTALDMNVTVTNVANSGEAPVVSFHIEDSNGIAITTAQLNRVDLYLADLVPTGTDVSSAGGPVDGYLTTEYFKRWTNERAVDGGVAAAGLDVTGQATGDYVYTFQNATSLFTTLGVTDTYTSTTDSQRVMITTRPADETVFNRAVGILDFAVPADGSNTTGLGYNARMFVTVATCKKCHGPNMAGAAHASSYRDTRGCVVCHSPLYNAAMRDEGVQLSVFIHKIHAALAVEAFPTRINGNGYVDVTFPQEIKDCAICHNNDSGEAVGAGNLVDNWKNNPNGIACSPCHTGNTMNADGSMNHSAASQAKGAPSSSRTDLQCAGCHGPADIETYHDLTPVAIDTPEYDVNVTLDPVQANYAAGDIVSFIVTLDDHATGLPVDPALYQTAQDAAYVAGGGRISPASISTAIVMWPPAYRTQSNSLFGTYDATANGFKFDLTIPADAATSANRGTFMYRVRIADYSYDRNNAAPAGQDPYHIESTAYGTFRLAPRL